MLPRTIAILGGGLSGLSSAFHLSRRFPSAQILLLEKENRLGSWVQSDRVQVPQIPATVVLERGPRTLRPNGKSVLELINLLHLEDSVLKTFKTTPPAQARFLYIPPSYGGNATGLQLLPSSILSLFSSPFLSDIFWALIGDAFKGPNRPADIADESVDSFLSRRFGDKFASKFGSALVHGIYAADSCQVSVKAAFPFLWQAEETGRGSVTRGFLFPFQKQIKGDAYELGCIPDIMHNVAVYSFKNGMETLICALEDYLEALPNVTIMKNTRILRLEPLKNSIIQISHSSGEPIKTTHAVSALPLPTLHAVLGQQSPFPNNENQQVIPHLERNPSSTVQVLNLIFACPPAEIHPEGFGYLVPRPPKGYTSLLGSSSLGILGVVFDSCSLHEQDSPTIPDYYHKGSHTKVTVMMGGPYPCQPCPPKLLSIDRDSPPSIVHSVLDELKIQLNRDLPDPVYWRIWNNESCIPTLLPGHMERVQEMQRTLKVSPKWNGRLSVIGAGIGVVSVADCIEAGRRVGRDWEANGPTFNGDSAQSTFVGLVL